MKRTGPTNERTKELIAALHKLGNERDVRLWKQIAFELEKSTRLRREVNLLTINKHTKENEVVLVPGKILGNGELTHKVTVAAFNASQSALEKIKQSGGKFIMIDEIMRTNPEGAGIRIIG